jgi:hypothetical protein
MNVIGGKRITLNKFDKFRRASRPYRIIFGMGLVTAAAATGTAWMYVGIAPLLFGLVDFCPMCVVTKKCSI